MVEKGEFMGQIRGLLELLYFASAPALVIVGLIGLRQLKISRDNARIDAKRRALALASEQCAYYLNYIIPLINRANQTIEAHDIKYFKMIEVEAKENGLHAKSAASRQAITKEVDRLFAAKEVQNALLDAYNALEGFAVYFTSGTADESVAFSAVGHTYCNSVQALLPDLYICTQDGQFLQNLMKLFYLWNDRIRAESLLCTREGVEKELAAIEMRTIPPIGTE